MSHKTKFLRLDSLVAYLQSESDGDEIFIEYNNKKVFPADEKFIKMTNEPVALNVEIELDPAQQWVELQLWDYDRFTPNDSLGKFRLLVDQVSENFTAELVRNNDSEGKYVLNWSVIERLNHKMPRQK